MREAKFVEDFVQTGSAQSNLPLLLQQGLDVPHGPLIGIETVLRRRFVEEDVPKNLPPLRAQGLRAGPFLRREEGVKAPMKIAIQPLF